MEANGLVEALPEAMTVSGDPVGAIVAGLDLPVSAHVESSQRRESGVVEYVVEVKMASGRRISSNKRFSEVSLAFFMKLTSPRSPPHSAAIQPPPSPNLLHTNATHPPPFAPLLPPLPPPHPQFQKLHQNVRSAYTGSHLAVSFPPMVSGLVSPLTDQRSSKFIDARQQALDAYLSRLVDFPKASQAVRAFGGHR